MRLTFTLLILLLAASAAHADTFKGRASAGPALAGDAVLWGEERADGSAVLYRRAPGQPRQAIVRLEAPTQRGHSRGFGGVPGAVAASPTRIAYTLSNGVTR